MKSQNLIFLQWREGYEGQVLSQKLPDCIGRGLREICWPTSHALGTARLPTGAGKEGGHGLWTFRQAVGLGRALLSCHVASVAGFDFWYLLEVKIESESPPHTRRSVSVFWMVDLLNELANQWINDQYSPLRALISSSLEGESSSTSSNLVSLWFISHASFWRSGPNKKFLWRTS